jgi:hypothetical protein
LEREKLHSEGAAVIAGVVVRDPEDLEEEEEVRRSGREPKATVGWSVASLCLYDCRDPPNHTDFFPGSLPAPPSATE